MLSDIRRESMGIWAESNIEAGQGDEFVDKKRQLKILTSLGKTARNLHSELARVADTIRATGSFEAPEGSAVLVEFPKNAWGIEVRKAEASGDEDAYVSTDLRWWNQAGAYGAALPTDSSVRLDKDANVAFVGKTIEPDEAASSMQRYPVFYVYNSDRSMRVLHGIGWTEVSLEPLEEVELVYNQDPPGVPVEMQHTAELLRS